MQIPNKLVTLAGYARDFTAFLKDAVLLALAALLLVLTIKAFPTLNNFNRFLTTTTTTINNIGQTTTGIGAATIQIENKAADQDARVIAIEAKMEALTDQANQTVQAATRLLNTANDTLKSGQTQLIPSIVETVNQANTAIATLNQQEKKLGTVADSANQTITELNLQTLPKFNAELDEVHATTVQADATMAKANDAVGHVDHAVAYYDHKLTRVKSTMEIIAGHIVNFGEHLAADFVSLKLIGQL